MAQGHYQLRSDMLCISFFPKKNLFSLEKDYADVIMLTYHKRSGGVNLNGVKSTSFS